MLNWIAWSLAVPALLAAPAWSSDRPGSLLEVPVASTTVVPPEAYAAASSVAAEGGGATAIALAVAGPFEGRTQLVIQDNESGEASSSSEVTVIRDGLLDDAIQSERWDVALARAVSGAWTINEVRKAWRCRRGAAAPTFAAAACP